VYRRAFIFAPFWRMEGVSMYSAKSYPRIFEQFLQPGYYRLPTASDKGSSEFDLVVFECTRAELRQRAFKPTANRKILAVEPRLWMPDGLWPNRSDDVAIYNAKAKRFGWKRRAVAMICTRMRDAESVVKGAEQIVKALVKKGEYAPGVHTHIMDWSGMGDEKDGILISRELKLPSFVSTEAFAGIHPLMYLHRFLNDAEATIATIRQRLSAKQRKPRLRVVGGKRGAA
jgi:hypothetical protein